jgi:predicted aconitase
MFGEPAWEILLELYCIEAAGKVISVSSACVAGGSPYSTGLRWLKYLVEAGLVIRVPDKNDLRFEWVKLEADCRQQIEAYLKSM